MEELSKLKRFHSDGCVELYFGDASHFGTGPNVPYAWQAGDEPVLLPSVRSRSLSVLGLLSPCSKLFRRTYEGSVNSRTMISFLDEFSNTISKKTVVVLDNAPIHKSKMFAEKNKRLGKTGRGNLFHPALFPRTELDRDFVAIYKIPMAFL